MTGPSRETYVYVAVLVLSVLAGCGAEPPVAPPQSQFAFKMHAQVTCNPPPGVELKALLEVSEVAGVCLLTVRADRTVGGRCNNVPTGAVRTFRLVYYTTFDKQYDLAYAVLNLDLTDPGVDEVDLDFSIANLEIEGDWDGDGADNLTEYCRGTHPGVID